MAQKDTALAKAVLVTRIAGFTAVDAVKRLPRIAKNLVVTARASANGIRGSYAQSLYRRPSDLRMHPLGIAMLEEAGIDRAVYGRIWLDRDGGTAAGPPGPFRQQAMLQTGIGFSVDLGNTATLNSGFGGDEGYVTLRGMALPETVLVGLAGHTLDEVVDHPLLKDRGYRIAYAHLTEAGDTTVLRMHPMAWEPIIPTKAI